MLQNTLFSLRYAYNNLRRGGLWTVFAIFCIAAGVSAVVALRGLGLSIEDTLTSTVRESNNGDVSISRGPNNPFSSIVGIEGVGQDTPATRRNTIFDEQALADIREYVDANGGEMTAYYMASGVQVAAVDSVTNGRPQFMSVFFIDPNTYTPIRIVETLDGTPINMLLQPDEFTVLVSDNFAEMQRVQVGDTVRISRTEQPFTVAGIIPVEEEASLFDLIASFFGFVYIHEAHAQMLDISTDPNRIAIVFPEGTDLRAADRALERLAPDHSNVRNVDRLRERLGEIADIIGRLIVIMGLGALVIGGVGIINTMLVMVRRRTMEIATLKTFGLSGGQIAAMFAWEALLLGIAGSVAGVLLGWLLGGAVNRFGEAFLQQPLVWRLYPQAALYGLVLGITVTSVFGVMPILTATKVRPNIVLRPNETHIPVVGWLQSLGVLLIVVLSIGIMVGSILSGIAPNLWAAFGVGIIGTALALMFIGLLIVLMWVVVWLVSRLPAFGNVDLRLALRNLTSRRWRTATTLVALAAGMYALSSITFLSQTTRELVNFGLTNTLGGNVLVFPLTTIFSSPELADPVLTARLSTLEGIDARTRSDVYFGRVTEVNGERIRQDLLAGNDEFGATTDVVVFARTSDNPRLNSGNLIAGRELTPDDVGQPVAVLRQVSLADGGSLYTVGQTVTLRVDGRGGGTYALEVVGLVEENSPSNPAGLYMPVNVLESRPRASLTTLQVAPEHLDAALLSLTALPTFFVLDLSFIDGLIQRLIAQFSAIPTIVGLLALLAAGAIMANTVLLATLERRKQIGVLKAVGLKGNRVMGVLLLENSLIALLGAGIGIGLSGLNAYLLAWAGMGEGVRAIPPNSIPWVVGLVLAALLIAWLATLASASVIVRERVSHVLRYD